MPGGLIFHKGDAFSLGGVRDNHGRAGVDLASGIKSLKHLAQVVAIDLKNIPVEIAPFGDQRLERHDFMNSAIKLDIIEVKDSGEIRQPELGGGHHPFPDYSAWHLPSPSRVYTR